MEGIVWKMNVIGLSMAFLIISNYRICGEELNAVAGDESTTLDALDAFEAFEAAEETIDPQQEHDQFEQAYKKLYKSHGIGMRYQQIVRDDAENRAPTTNPIIQHGSNDENDSLLTTTMMPQYELQAIDTSVPENISSRYSETNESKADGKQSNDPNSDDLLSRLSETIDTSSNNEYDGGESVGDHSKFEKNIQRIVPVYFVQSDASNIGQSENDTIDYVNDDGNMHEENSSQPITMPYSIDTTNAPLPSAVNQLQTNGVSAVTMPVSTMTITTTTTTAPVGPSPNDPNILYVLVFAYIFVY